MTYVVPPVSKKNAITAKLVSPILAADLTAVFDDASVFYDKDGNLITKGYVMRNPNSLVSPSPEEVTISACSVAYGVGGACTVMFSARGVNYDVNTGGNPQGAAQDWPAGTLISVMISIGVFNVLTGDIADLHTNKQDKIVVGIAYGVQDGIAVAYAPGALPRDVIPHPVCTGSESDMLYMQFVSLQSFTDTEFTVNIKTNSGSPGNPMTIIWIAVM